MVYTCTSIIKVQIEQEDINYNANNNNNVAERLQKMSIRLFLVFHT